MTTRYLTTVLPTNSTGSLSVVLSGSNNVAWSQPGFRFSLFRGGRIIELSQNTTSDVAIDGQYVVWEDNFRQLKVFDGDRTTLLRNAVVTVQNFDLFGNRIVWVDGNGSGNNEIYYYNGSSTARLTRNTANDNHPQLFGNYAVWDSQGKIHLKSLVSGADTIISQGSFNDRPQIDGNYVAWIGSDSPTGLSPIVQLYNIVSGQRISLNKDIHVPGTSTLDARISGNYVAWVGSDGNDKEIYLYNIRTKTRTKLTNNTTDDDQVELSGDTVVWRGNDGNDTEIYYHTISSGQTRRMTNNATDDRDPVISGTNIAWTGQAGVHLATLTTFSTTSATLTPSVGNLQLLGTAPINGTGNTSNNILTGNNANNRLTGLQGDDHLIGGGGADVLVGGEGVDLLTGKSGGDRFIFDQGRPFTRALGIDEITDFSRVQGDKIVLDRTTFTVLGSAVSFAAVANQSQARTSTARITYVAATGDLFYNQNGALAGFGSGGQFAKLQNGLILNATDFVVVA